MGDGDVMRELRVGLALADMADDVCRRRFRAPDLVVDRKPNLTPVSDADREIERLVVARLRDDYPAVPIYGEEHGPAYDGTASTYWAIDPIDGSAAFIAGEPGWGFLVCLVRDGEPVAGVASSIGLGRRWWAATGQGATTQTLPVGSPSPLAVSTAHDLRTANIGWWDGYRITEGGRVSALDPVVENLRKSCSSVVATGAGPLAVAAGQLDAALMRAPNEEPHHASTFIVLVKEAGGAISVLPDNTILFSNGAIHDDLLRAVH
jgi:histidinol-phosphatase